MTQQIANSDVVDCVPKTTNKLNLICCSPVQLAALKKPTYFSCLAQMTAGAQFVSLGSNKGLGAPDPSSLFWVPGGQCARSPGDSAMHLLLTSCQWKTNSCGPIEGKMQPCDNELKAFSKVLSALPETGAWLWCSGHVSAKGSQEPVLSYGCMGLKLQQRATALELGREIPLPIITAHGCIEHRPGCNSTGS